MKDELNNSTGFIFCDVVNPVMKQAKISYHTSKVFVVKLGGKIVTNIINIYKKIFILIV